MTDKPTPVVYVSIIRDPDGDVRIYHEEGKR